MLLSMTILPFAPTLPGIVERLPVEYSTRVKNRTTNLVNEALAASGVEQRFILMAWVGQDVPIALGSPATFRRAVEAGLISATDPHYFHPDAAAHLARMG